MILYNKKNPLNSIYGIRYYENHGSLRNFITTQKLTVHKSHYHQKIF
jgi:hypothetical protein